MKGKYEYGICREANIILAAAYDVIEKRHEYGNSRAIDIDFSGVDWQKVYKYAVENACVTMTYLFLKQHVQESVLSEFQREYTRRRRKKELMKNELIEAMRCLSSAGIEGIYIKGFVLGENLYGDMYFRDFGDIDIIFSPETLVSARNTIMKKMDYKQVNQGVEKEDYLDVTGVFHEFWLRKTINEIPILIEVKNSTSAVTQEYISDFVKNPVIYQFDGLSFKTMDRYYSLLHLFINVYENFESKNGVFFNTNIRDLLDCYLAIEKFYQEIDWKKLGRMAVKYRAVHKVHCIINYVNFVFPSEHLTALSALYSSCAELGYNGGMKWPWKHNVTERMFMERNERIKEYYQLAYERVIGKADHENSYVISLDTNESLNDFDNYKIIMCNECDYKIRYKFSYDDQSMYINFLMDKITYERKDIIIQFLFLLGNAEKSVWLKNTDTCNYCIREDIGDLGLEFNNVCKEYFFPEDNYVIKIPAYDMSEFENGSNETILGYNVQLYSTSGRDLMIQRMTLFGNKFEMEETFDEMGVCKIRKPCEKK